MDETITNTDLKVTSLRKAYGGSKVSMFCPVYDTRGYQAKIQVSERARHRHEEVNEITELYKQKSKIYRILIRKAKEAKWKGLIGQIETD
ncbi:hypothetical protein TcasGA2_TC014847 [Tribolium castaneum]|uniref:Uncharacterized protein n=1 Tax=Tribolium castaneum TaxID=7070 RepID=D2A4D8_TRICA|nr:hypothetical protein TcasGA2_TC014847 [Tribolium castaneum]